MSCKQKIIALCALCLGGFWVEAQPWTPVQTDSTGAIYKQTNFFRNNTNLWWQWIPSPAWTTIPDGTITTNMMDATAYAAFTLDTSSGTTYIFQNTNAELGIYTNGAVVLLGTNLPSSYTNEIGRAHV